MLAWNTSVQSLGLPGRWRLSGGGGARKELSDPDLPVLPSTVAGAEGGSASCSGSDSSSFAAVPVNLAVPDYLDSEVMLPGSTSLAISGETLGLRALERVKCCDSISPRTCREWKQIATLLHWTVLPVCSVTTLAGNFHATKIAVYTLKVYKFKGMKLARFSSTNATHYHHHHHQPTAPKIATTKTRMDRENNFRTLIRTTPGQRYN